MLKLLEYIQNQINYSIDIYYDNQLIQNPNDQQIILIQKANTIVIGDLHGNINKAIEILILAKVITLEINSLKIFRNLFNSNRFENSDIISELIEIIKTIKINSTKKIIFLGDILGDRVGNDILGLVFINHLRTLELSVETLIGNHDHVCNFNDVNQANFMKDYADSFFKALSIIEQNQNKYNNQYQVNNLLKNFISKSKLIILEKNTLFIHGAIRKRNLITFQKLLVSLNILPRDFVLDANSLPFLCDQINQFYINYRNNNLYQNKKYVIENCILKDTHDFNQREFEGFLWVGEHHYLKDYKLFLELGVETIIHGHDSFDKDSVFNPKNKSDNQSFTVINLDNICGKNLESDNEVLPLFCLFNSL